MLFVINLWYTGKQLHGRFQHSWMCILEVDSLTIKWAAVALATYHLLDSPERDRQIDVRWKHSTCPSHRRPLNRLNEQKTFKSTIRVCSATYRRRQRRTVLPRAVPRRRQKRCKVIGMQCVSDCDPKVHLAPWHNDRPFVLGLYDRRLKKCWGCRTTFGVDERFVIRHQELREFWKKDVGRTMVSTSLF